MDRLTSGPNTSGFLFTLVRAPSARIFVQVKSIIVFPLFRSRDGELSGPFFCDGVSALATASAFVARADGRLQTVERDEVVHYIHRRPFATTRQHITCLFDERARQLQEADFANVVLEALRPVPSMSLTLGVIRIAERVAA